MPSFNIMCCNRPLNNGEVWFLNDIKNFTARKLYKTQCPVCKEDIVLLFEKRISDNKIFINEIKGIEAVKTIYRENKRKLQIFPDIKTNDLYGWVYGINIQIKKNGKITQLRQYSSDFKGKRVLVKKILAP